MFDTPKPLKVEWYIVFVPSNRRYWFSRWLHPDYGHCFALRYDGYNWVEVNPFMSYLSVRVLENINSGALADVVDAKQAEILHLEEVIEARNRQPWLLGPITCTEVCKALLGIKAFWVITPFQLYRFLRRRHSGRWRRVERIGRSTRAQSPKSGGA